MEMASLSTTRRRSLVLVLAGLVCLELAGVCVMAVPEVNQITPRRGSIRGATRIVIEGRDFSPDPFSFGEGNENKGNKVYLYNSTASIECDVLPYWSNVNRITCDTRSATAGKYTVLLFVDGTEITKLGGAYCSNINSCTFEYSDSSRTPTIDTVTPTSGTPGTLIDIRGKLFTDLFASTQQEDAEDIDDSSPEIQRVYWGNYICDLTDPETDELYGITLDDDGNSNWGNMKLVPKGTFIESQQFSFLISGEYGRCLNEPKSLRVSGQNKIYNYQTHAEITGVSPSSGGVEGGTVLTIMGNFFYDQAETVVTVGGVPCEIDNITDNIITCVTQKAPDTKDTYPGSRGILWEQWTDYHGSLDDAEWDVNADNYVNQSRLDGDSPDNIEDNFVGRLRGYFVPPRDGDYRFLIRSDDESQLFFSFAGDSSDLAMIAECPQPTSVWTKYPEQMSQKLSLQGGAPYYMEARYRDGGGGDYVEIGFEMFDAPITNSQIESAHNEKQYIAIDSTVNLETQSLKAVGTYEVQEVKITYAGCNDTNEGMNACNTTQYFWLTYEGKSTDHIPIHSSAEEVEEQLSNLTSVPVMVTLEENEVVMTYTVLFLTYQDLPLLSAESSDSSLVGAVVLEIASGSLPSNTSFVLHYGDVEALNPVSTTSSAKKVQETLLEMFGVRCEHTSAASPYFFRDYETQLSGLEWGQRVQDREPYCGRTSLMNPSYIFYADEMKHDSGERVAAFRVDYVDKLCFGFKGAINSYMLLYLTYTALETNEVTHSDWYEAPELAYYEGYTSNWEYECIDLYEMVMTQGWIKDNVLEGTPIKVSRIYTEVATLPEDELFIDNLFVGSDNDHYIRTSLPAMPNDIFVVDVEVSKIELGFDITFNPANCGFDFPLLGIKDATILSGSADSDSNLVVYSHAEFTAGTNIAVERVVSATKPVVGTFELELDGKYVTVPADASAKKMKELVETNLDTGIVLVNQYGTCAGYEWDVEWASKGGSQPLMKINDTGLIGLDVWASIVEITEGRLFQGSIPGEYLRMPHDSPQVEVMVNYIPAICAVGSSCSFSYDLESTPHVTSVTPTSGSHHSGTVITISGSGFSNTPYENIVTIGGAICDVIGSTETAIECAVGQGPMGEYPVVIRVDGKGLAAYPSGDVIFTYESEIIGVEPPEGSTVGGTQLTISGYGFPCGNGTMDDEHQVFVTVGTQPCNVLSMCYDEIICKIAMDRELYRHRNREGPTVDVIVSIQEADIVSSNAFTYNESLTATISDVSPITSSVLGGTQLTIIGDGFGDSGATVTIGEVECDVVTQSQTEVTCNLPGHEPGTYDLEVTVGNQGYADISLISQFRYILQVTGVSPDTGSLAGGSQVTITGEGFGTSLPHANISFGDVYCEVESVSDTEIRCVTRPQFSVVMVDNQGKHEDYGKGYKWNPQLLEIVVGDTVSWEWLVPTYVTGIGYTVQQTADADSVEYDGAGFRAGPRSAQGSYNYTFTAPGMYYYSSGPVDDDATLYMKGIVRVSSANSTTERLAVLVGGYEASYNTSLTSVPSDSSSSLCPTTTALIPSCTASIPGADDNNNHFFFTFSECSTPIITNISPNSGTSLSTIKISGTGFGDDPCQNEILVGDHVCVPSAANSTYIECTINTEETLPVGYMHPISLSVNNRGLATNQVMTPMGRAFKMVPSIDGISIATGSTEGGTRLLISGDGFSASSPDKVRVIIGGAQCVVDSVSYKEVECVTSKPIIEGTFEPILTINFAEAEVCNRSVCRFTYGSESTPVVTGISPTDMAGASTTLTISGTGFSSNVGDVTVTVGGVYCEIVHASETEIQCDVGYVPAGEAELVVNILNRGNSALMFDDDKTTLWSETEIYSVSPNEGSLQGGQLITVTGNGFHVDNTVVTINELECTVQNITISQIECISQSHSSGVVDLVVLSGAHNYPAESYEYSLGFTPQINAVVPTSGATGDAITLSGSEFGSAASDITVIIDGVECVVTSASSYSIECTVGAHSAGVYEIELHVNGMGNAISLAEFEYVLTVGSTMPSSSSFGGGRTLTIDGSGFGDESSTTVTVCGNECLILEIEPSQIQCDVPGSESEADTEDCDITVTLLSGSTVTLPNAWQYRLDMTPIIDFIDPPRGGTGGGTTLTIVGAGFSLSGNIVTIGGTECSIISESETEIVCRTGAHPGSEKTKVRVEVGSYGIALQANASYYYVDVWSSKYTWGGKDPPIEGDFVIVPAGQTLLLDVDTPVLAMLLIEGGSVIFDEADITLNSEYILITDMGLLQVGTEEEPFQHKGTIMLHGNVRSKELPIYGAKVLAVRNGTLDLHGIPVPVTWTYLADSISVNDTTMTLVQPVTWSVGDQIVIASTGHRHSQRENEFLTITEISADGRTLTFDPPVQYGHISLVQTIDGVTLETRAEVGLLTRNVVVRGSVQQEWVEDIEACAEEFDTNQFAILTCFLGRFGEETASDEFGSTIMLATKEKDKQWAVGRIEYTEITHAGQAYRLGRYPVHFHLCGDVTGSYIRGCGIHHTFNRATTIHGVSNLLVEHNVVFNVMGHAVFFEDGIETKNTVQYNLAVFVRPSSSLLNSDITPAAFWVTNADNRVRHNAAAGGSHFGFWYNPPVHPEGPSFTKEICPRNVPVLEFTNNTAHSQGWYGLWIFPTYYPKEGGQCSSTVPIPAEFYGLTAWDTERGAEATEVGGIRFINFLMSDNDKAGVEFQTTYDDWGGPMLKDSTIIGWSELSTSNKSGECTIAGLKLPKSRYLTIDNVKFINFDQDRCAAVHACSRCKPDQGGFQSRFQNIQYFNSPNKARWQWQHECWLEDLDGTLTGIAADYSVLPYNPNLPPHHCEFGQPAYGTDTLPGAVCDDTIKFHRMAFNNPVPESLRYKDTLFTNQYGTSRVNYHKKRLTHPEGWMVTLVDGDSYNFIFEDVDHVTNISYTGRLDDFQDGDFVLLGHNFTQVPDLISITGDVRNSSEDVPTYDDNEHGDWFFDEDTMQLSYLVSGKGESSAQDFDIDLDVYRCYYEDCIPPIPEPPPEGRPQNYSLWSDVDSWKYAEPGWGGNKGNGSYGMPVDGDDVMILPDQYMVADVDLPVMGKLFIYGTLELDDSRDFTLTATYILIQGGRLVIGQSESKPFTHNVVISLEGNHSTPDIPLPNGPNLGSKALGSFGGLDLHGRNHTVYWTHLATTVSPGINTITVTDDTDWEAGNEIVVTTTSYEAWHTETFSIVSVVDERTLVLNDTFQYKHLSQEYTVSAADISKTYFIRAEVGLLTRNIKIEGADYSELFDESFGARVIVGKFYQDGVEYRGYARISNVEFFHSGQEGWTGFYDPRYSLAFLDSGMVDEAYPSFVKGCSFHNGFSTAIGLYGAHEVLVQDNVIHHTVGPAIIDWSSRNRLIHNLVSLVIFPGTYQDRYESENLMWNAGIEVEEATNPVLIDNVVTGSERVGFKIGGEPCGLDPNPATDWRGNVARGTLHGVHIFPESVMDCAKIANFEIHKSFDFGIYFQIKASVIITDTILVDNKVGVMPIIYEPNALSHQTSAKFLRMENSLVVGMSPDFECNGIDDVIPENAGQSSEQRGPQAPSGGHAGFICTTFESKLNKAPFKSFHRPEFYPAISGVTFIQNTLFSQFQSRCGRSNVMIMTNPESGDYMHPIQTTNIYMDGTVDVDNVIWFHRPDVSLVNPHDCVDMDCDGMKKAMIRDLDGSLLGSVGTVVPQAEFEWDGDPRRGLGDYRIPKMLLTRPDGSSIPTEEKCPNKGIYRGNSGECEWKAEWTAYECHNVDHMGMVIESFDEDTETRRVSPVALYTDGYVDLINGPEDHGCCFGYSCQERISTFYALVATNQEYEVYFTGTNPQSLRLHMLNAVDTQKVVVGIWYSNPQRLDIYINGIYILPNNGGYNDKGEFVWENDLTPEEYKPSLDSNVYGENYYNRDLQTLYVMVRGDEPVDIRTAPIVMLTIGVPSSHLDDFYEEDLVNNLVGYLDIDESQIRIVDVIAEDSARRRRTAGEGEFEVGVEIGDGPATTIQLPTNETTTYSTVSPPSTTPDPVINPLDYDALVSIQSVIANDMQQGVLGDIIDLPISSLVMLDPLPTPVDPTGGFRATNETEQATNGTRYEERQQDEEEPSYSDGIVYQTVAYLAVFQQPSGASDYEVFATQPKVQAFDLEGNPIVQLGSPSNPWQLTATIYSNSSHGDANLLGNTTLPFENGWVNYTNLAIDILTTNVVLEFSVTYPNTSTLTTKSAEFSVDPRDFYAAVVESPDVAFVDESFGVTVEVRDVVTSLAPDGFAEKGYEWMASASLYMLNNYLGQLRGDLEVTFDPDTAQAHFGDLTIDKSGYQYIIEVHVWTVPNSFYDFKVQVDPFDVRERDSSEHDGKAKKITWKFSADYEEVVMGLEDFFIINFLNNIGPMYPNVTMSDVDVSPGSILVEFDIQGDTEATQRIMYEDLFDEVITLNFNGHALQADTYMLVDGKEYDPRAVKTPTLPSWVIPVIVTLAVLLAVIVIAMVVVICKKNDKTKRVESIPLSQTPPLHKEDIKLAFNADGVDAPAALLSLPTESEQDLQPGSRRGSGDALLTLKPAFANVMHLNESETGSLGNRSPSPDLRSKSSRTNTPHRSPEVIVTSLPPGYSEGQEEKLQEDRHQLALMARNLDGSISKLGKVNVNLVGTVYDLRHDVSAALTGQMASGQGFVMMNHSLLDIVGSEERKLAVSEVYTSDCVFIRWLSEDDLAKMCVCGVVGEFSCSLCQVQWYCSPQCQSKDWHLHKADCSNTSTV